MARSAKAQMRHMQRKDFTDYCCECKDPVDTAAEACRYCGLALCRDCKLDRECIIGMNDREPPRGQHHQ